MSKCRILGELVAMMTYFHYLSIPPIHPFINQGPNSVYSQQCQTIVGQLKNEFPHRSTRQKEQLILSYLLSICTLLLMTSERIVQCQGKVNQLPILSSLHFRNDPGTVDSK